MTGDREPAARVMPSMRSLTFALLVLAAACSSGAPGPSAQQAGKDEFALAYGASLVVPGTPLEIGFQALLGDSRCPSDVVCVWEGEGRVELGVTLGDGPTVAVELNTRGPRALNHGGYTIELVALAPYPVSTIPRQPADYVVTVRVTSGGPGQ